MIMVILSRRNYLAMKKIFLKPSTWLIVCFALLAPMVNTDDCFSDEAKIPGILFSRYSGENWQIWVKEFVSGREYQLTFSTTDKRSPQCNSDGKRFVYRTANSELYLFDMQSGSESENLSQFGFIMDQRWSSDGKMLAFSRLRSDLLDDSDIWVSDMTGGKVKCLTNETGIQFNPAWSLDSRRIAYASDVLEDSDGFAIWLMDADGKNKQHITSGKKYDVEPSFSPDGKRVVFSSNRTGDFEIWLTDTETSAEKRLTYSPGIDTTPVFSPDGNKIIFTSFRNETMQLWEMDKNGQRQIPMTSTKMPSKEPCWCELDNVALEAIKTKEQNK